MKLVIVEYLRLANQNVSVLLACCETQSLLAESLVNDGPNAVCGCKGRDQTEYPADGS